MKAAAGAGARKDAVADISKFVSRSAAADTDSSRSVAKIHCRIEVKSSQVKSSPTFRTDETKRDRREQTGSTMRAGARALIGALTS